MSRVHPLVHRFLEDPSSLDETELDRLATYLREHPQRAVELREHLLIDDYLCQMLAIDRQNFFAQIEQRVSDYQRGQEEMYDHVAELRLIAEAEIDKPLREPTRSTRLKYSLAAAMALSLVAAVAVWQFWKPAPKAVALIEEISGEVTILRGGKPITPQLGKAVYTGDQIASTSGSTIKWHYKDQSEVRLVGHATSIVTADSRTGAKQIKLEEGELAASVAPQIRGAMIFSTPHATATVRGTQLRLVVGQTDTQLDVSEGRVDLTRLSDGQTISVAANETGLASAERIGLRMPQWPVERSRAIYLFQGNPQDVLCRNPHSGNLRQSELTPLDDDATLGSADDGADITTLIQRSGEFTLELAIAPQAAGQEVHRLLSLGATQEPGIQLLQQEAVLRAIVKGNGGESAELPVSPTQPDQRIHLLVAGRNGRVAAYVNGVLIAERNDLLVDTGTWQAGPLVVVKSVQRLALFAHYMDAAETRREWERFKLATE